MVGKTGAMLGVCVLVLASGTYAFASGDKPQQARAEAAIEWHLPHQFSEAREASKKQSRILLIKGVSFGIDEAGAQCATKGKW